MKLARNMLTFTGFAAACEAPQLAEKAGLDLQQLGRVVRHTDALTMGPGAIMIRDNIPRARARHWLYDTFAHTPRWGKDLNLALALGDSLMPTFRWRGIALRNLAAGLGVPHDRDGEGAHGEWTNAAARAWAGKMNEVYGWEMPDLLGTTSR